MSEQKPTQRHLARIKALCALYQSEVGQTEIVDALRDFSNNEEYPEKATTEYADRLAEGVKKKNFELDDVIGENLTVDWVVERLTIIDRIILKIAVYEILHVDDVPTAVAINEAVELAKEYSTEDAQKFINGVLGSVVRNLDL